MDIKEFVKRGQSAQDAVNKILKKGRAMSPPTPVYTMTERWYRTGNDIGSETRGSDGARGSHTVAEIVGHARQGTLSENDLRNARLIAACPSLYEYVKEAAKNGDKKALDLLETLALS